MNSLWSKIVEFFKRIFGPNSQTIPPEVANQDANLTVWWDVYRAKAPWLPYQFITADGKRRTRNRLTLNPAKIIVSELAGLIVAEGPEIRANEALAAILDECDFWTNLRRSTEYQLALGGQAIKIYRQDGKVQFDFVRAFNFIPLKWSNRQVTEAAFVDRRAVGNKTYTRVETHRKAEENGIAGYRIESKALDADTGQQVSLSIAWGDLQESVFVPTDLPLFAYIANPEANNIDPESPLGISVYQNALDTIQAMDIAFDGYRTEMVLGRQRVALPSTVMRGYMDPETGARKLGFDPSDEAYIRLEGDDADKLKPVDLSGALRMGEWKQAIQIGLDLLCLQTGFSSGFFQFDGASGVKTATEVIAENSRTYKTVQGQKDTIRAALEPLFSTAAGLAGAPVDVEIVFPDSVIEDRNAQAAYHAGLVGAGLEDKTSAIMAVHRLLEDEAQIMADKIKEETKPAPMPDIFGGAGA